MESHTDTATVEAPEVESTEAVESLPQESTQDSFLDALDSALSNITDSNLGDAEAEEPKEEGEALQPETEDSDDPPLADKEETQEYWDIYPTHIYIPTDYWTVSTTTDEFNKKKRKKKK